MSAAKSSRSRASGQGIVVSKGRNAQEVSLQLEEKLKVFKTDNFDPDGFVQPKCQTMTEKEIRQLCAYLLDLKKASAEEMRKSVYANYTSFIWKPVLHKDQPKMHLMVKRGSTGA